MTAPDKTPRQRWGTCCPFDPECDHSFIDADTLAEHMDTPISDAEANRLAGLEAARLTALFNDPKDEE